MNVVHVQPISQMITLAGDITGGEGEIREFADKCYRNWLSRVEWNVRQDIEKQLRELRDRPPEPDNTIIMDEIERLLVGRKLSGSEMERIRGIING